MLLVGVVGLLLISMGWALSLKLEAPPPLRLSALYFAGSIMLSLYALSIGDAVFTALNLLAAVLSLANAVKRYGGGKA